MQTQKLKEKNGVKTKGKKIYKVFLMTKVYFYKLIKKCLFHYYITKVSSASQVQA